jgi:MFS family permease
MRIAVNGVFGNLGVASAALITGYFIDNGGWRAAFVVPGVVSILIGFAYAALQWDEIRPAETAARAAPAAAAPISADRRAILMRVSAIVFATTAISSIIFQSTTFALPKIFDERLQGLAAETAAWSDRMGLPINADVATAVGVFAFVVFSVASLAQLVVGSMLDKHGPRTVFLTVAAIQLVFFGLMPGLHDTIALAAAFGFMLGAFGQIPINDYMIGKMASGPFRARIYGVRYVVSFTVLAAALPLIAFVHQRWGFATLFVILAGAAAATIAVVALLPRELPGVRTKVVGSSGGVR